MSIDVNVQNDLVIVTETTEDIVVNVSNAAGPQGPAGAAGVGVPVGGSTGQVLKKFSATNYDTYWAEDASGLTSVALSVPTGLSVTNSPLTTNGSIAVGLASGYSIPTTASQATWDAAYNDKINSAAVTGTTTKTLTLNQQDGGTITAFWTDDNTDAVTSVFGRTGAVVATSGDYTTTQVTEGTNLYFTGDRVRATLLTGLNLVGGGTIAATDSILQAFGKTQNQISALVGGVMYEGVWNASTNSPAIVSSVGSKGDYYVVNVAGSTNIDGITDWKVGDWIIFNGTTWDKVDNTDAVSSVNGFTGAVSLTTANISEVTNLYYTEGRVSANTDVAANTAARHNAVTLGTANGLSLSTQALSLALASGSTTGALSSTDWSTFNGKQNAITLTTTGTSGASTLVGSTLNIPQYADQFVGTVTSVSALTLGTTGTDLSSTVANGTTTPVITLNVPTASATNRGALSSADWTTFNNKQNTITNPVTGTGTTNYIPKWTSGSAIGNSQVFDNGTNVGIGTLIPTAKLQVEGDGIVINTEGAAAAKYLYFRYSDGVDIQSDSYLKFSTSISPTERMRITSSGNLLVGTTTDAGYKLDVNGTGRFTSATFSSSVTAGGKGIFETNTTVGNDGTYTSYASVGLGGTTDGFNRVFGGVGTADGLFLASATGRGIFFRAGGGTTEHVSITSGGNLLVGTTIDTGEKLQVNGSGKFSSSVTATSFIKSGGTSSQYLMADGSVTTGGGGGGSVDELQVALLSQVYG